MNKLKTKILALVLATTAVLICGLLTNQSVYAEDGAAGSAIGFGTGTNTSGRGRYGPKYGATWIYYKYTDGFNEDLQIRHLYWSNSVSWTVIPAKCTQFGGFYLLANFEHDDNGKYTGGTYGVQEVGRLKEYGSNYVYRTKGDPNISFLYDKYTDDFGNGAILAEWGEPLTTVEDHFESLSDEAKMGYTWGTGSSLRWFCYGSKSGGSGSNVHSTSSVTFSGTTQTSALDSTTTMVIPSSSVNSSSTVVFTHRIVSEKDPSSGVNLVNVNWAIGGAYASSNNTPNGVLNLGSTGWSARTDGKWEKVVSISANVPVGYGGLFCQTISYNPKSYTIAGNNVSGSGTGSSTACVNIRPIVIPTPTCATLGGVSTKSANYGDTNGASRVMNANNISGDTGWQTTVWAKPGDTISFAHCFSWGVQAVTKSDTYGGGRSSPSIATSLSDRVGDSWFQISSARGSQYLFGLRKDQGTLGPRVTLQRFNSVARTNTGEVTYQPVWIGDRIYWIPYSYYGVIDAEQNGNYELVLMSPSKNTVDANRYSCLIFDFSQFIANGFQIPGFESWRGGCAASNATGRTNEVGTTISQQITYPYQQAWVYENHWESGECTCSVWGQSNSRTIHNSNNNWYPGGNGSASSDGNYYSSYYGCNDTSCGGSTNRIGCGGAVGNCTCTDPGHDRYYQKATCNGDCISTETYFYTWGSYTACTEYAQYDCSYWVEAQNNSYSCNGYSNKGYSVRYPVRFRDYGNRVSVASVNIPYNFRTADTSSINAGSTIYAGETVSSAFTASVLPVVNSSIKSTNSAYATVYPGDIRIEQFIIGPDSPIPAQTSGVLPIGGGSMCSYFGGTQCGSIPVTNTGNNWKNAEGRYNGWTWSMGATYNVPNNADIGSKYCVAIGMTIASSHPNADAGTVSGWHSFNGNWRVSLSCRTIAKKPNFQAWNANLFAFTGIDTAITSKYEDATLGTSSPANRIFGSWEEYLVISKGDVVGFASGAALGYEGSTMRITGGHSPTGNFCDLSHMSISNENCNHIGLSKINLNNAVLSKMITRYSPASTSMPVNSGVNINVAAASPLTNTTTDERTGEYIMTSGDGVINGTIARSANSPLLVIRVPGTLTINSNICYGTGSCQGYDNALVLGNRNSQRFSSLNELPQVIIIANNINISEGVTQIDAWLVALGSSGTINTCYQFNVGASSSDSCSKTLIINGPTIANGIILNRTAGAYTRSTWVQNDGPGASNNLTDDGSVTPAEIFNLRPDAYLWGYQQSQNFSQATITYSRELSPRY